MNPGGQQQFDLQVYDSSFQTKDPAAPIVGVDIMATVSVTVNWNDNRTAMTKDGVEYDSPVWQPPGAGPLALYDDAIGGQTVKVGCVTWSAVTKTLVQTETDPTNAKTRLAVTPTVQLFRNVVRNGALPDNHSVYTASATVYGNWA